MASSPITAPDIAMVDTETTGFRAKNGDRILEIAVVRMRADGEVVSSWSTLLNPGADVTLGATDIHGITREMLVGAPSFADVVGDFVAQVRGAVVGAHNAPFDIGFLQAEFAHAGYEWPQPPVADTLGAARFLMPGLASYKLGSLAEHLGIRFEGDAHSALADTHVAVRLYKELIALTRNIAWPDPTSVPWPEVAPSGLSKNR